MSFMGTEYTAQAKELVIFLTVGFQFLIVSTTNRVFLQKGDESGIDGVLA